MYYGVRNCSERAYSLNSVQLTVDVIPMANAEFVLTTFVYTELGYLVEPALPR